MNFKDQQRKFWAMASLLSLMGAAYGETITLKNGTVVKGSIITMTESDVTMETADMGQVTIKRRTIDSIKDGSSNENGGLSSQIVSAQQAPVQPLVVTNNNNNNNNNNQQQQQTAATTQKELAGTEVNSVPATPAQNSASGQNMTLAGSDSGSSRLSSLFAYAKGRSRINMDKDEFDMNADLNGIHVEPIVYTWNSGFTFKIAGEYLESRGKVFDTTLARSVVGLGWGSKPFRKNEGGFRMAMGLTAGVTNFGLKRTKKGSEPEEIVPEYSEKPFPSEISSLRSLSHGINNHSIDSINAFGDTYGLDWQISYITEAGFGLTAGVAGQFSNIRLTDNSVRRSEHDYRPGTASEINSSAYTGISVVF